MSAHSLDLKCSASGLAIICSLFIFHSAYAQVDPDECADAVEVLQRHASALRDTAQQLQIDSGVPREYKDAQGQLTDVQNQLTDLRAQLETANAECGMWDNQKRAKLELEHN